MTAQLVITFDGEGYQIQQTAQVDPDVVELALEHAKIECVLKKRIAEKRGEANIVQARMVPKFPGNGKPKG